MVFMKFMRERKEIMKKKVAKDMKEEEFKKIQDEKFKNLTAMLNAVAIYFPAKNYRV
jgi:hypothetical protein